MHLAGTGTREVFAKRFISDDHVKKDGAPAFTPGPGAYPHRAIYGKQPESKTNTRPAWGFGSADRFHVQAKQQRMSGAIPGPGAYFT